MAMHCRRRRRPRLIGRCRRRPSGWIASRTALKPREPWNPPQETRAAAEAAGCSDEDVARLAYRRDAIMMLAQTIDRGERLARLGFTWLDGRLESVTVRDGFDDDDARRAAMLAAEP